MSSTTTINGKVYHRYSVMLSKYTDYFPDPAVRTPVSDVFHPYIRHDARGRISDVTAWITGRFPDLVIDETDETIEEMISSEDIACGLFWIKLRKPGDPREISYSLCFMEV